MAELYADAIQEVSMLQFAPLIAMIYGTARNPIASSLQHIFAIFKASTVRTASKDDVPPLHDKGITIMKDAIHSLRYRAIKKPTKKKRRTHKKSIE
jgi:hypothetical protein